MSEIANNEGTPTTELEKPVQEEPKGGDVKFPPFPEPNDTDFDEDVSVEERNYYKKKFNDLNDIKSMKLHCTACDRHLGCSARGEGRVRVHPMLRTLVCHTCHAFYNSGEFEKGDDGSELYCRWCGQGGQVYCCSDCPHVFCAKCIKRNLGMPKIKEIENTDDWKCFKCNSNCLWDLRAICWALLRYCDLKNRITLATVDPELKEIYQKDCSMDNSECCRSKSRRKEKETKKNEKKDKEIDKSKNVNAVITKIPSTIQVKKFASISSDELPKLEKKAQKRPSSPRNKIVLKNPMTITPCRLVNPVSIPPLMKKIRMPNSPLVAPIKIGSNEKKQFASQNTYSRIRPKIQMPIPIITNHFNGFNNSGMYNNMNVINDNINLSLDNLTQGLDMSAMSSMSANTPDDDVVCTPDFPMEPLCEVMEDNDDDVQCITPGPVAAPKLSTPPPLVPRSVNSLPDFSSENIIQMTDNDVTVNTETGGLKFRVDPQTLSSNKMYRLPDGRIFAINANPNMPGGYSATIVAVTEPTVSKSIPKGQTYAAKVSTITTPPSLTSAPKSVRPTPTRRCTKANKSKTAKATRATETSRECNMSVPVEWYRYNVIDACDALEYSLSRLHKLKKDATTMFLRTRSIEEIRNLHRTLERLLNTSSTRFNEIKDNLNKGLKQYMSKKMGVAHNSEDDDDVEILPDLEDDDPIFIDENSVDSPNDTHCNESQEVDLTRTGSSEHNDSGSIKNDSFSKMDVESFNVSEQENDIGNGNNHIRLSSTHEDQILEKTAKSELLFDTIPNNSENEEIVSPDSISKKFVDNLICKEEQLERNELEQSNLKDENSKISNTESYCNKTVPENKSNTQNTEEKDTEIIVNEKLCAEMIETKEKEDNDSNDKILQDDKAEKQNSIEKDSDMSEEMIESLLESNDVDNLLADDNEPNLNHMDISEELQS